MHSQAASGAAGLPASAAAAVAAAWDPERQARQDRPDAESGHQGTSGVAGDAECPELVAEEGQTEEAQAAYGRSAGLEAVPATCGAAEVVGTCPGSGTEAACRSTWDVVANAEA